jgi:hypothetical protein
MGNHFQVVSFHNVIHSYPLYYVNAVVRENVDSNMKTATEVLMLQF